MYCGREEFPLKVKLELMSGAQDGDEFRINRSSTLGRDRKNDIPLQLDKYISRRHARIIIGKEGIFLEDLGSTNGTYYEGERIEDMVPLENGDFFRVGRTWIQISW